MLRDASGNSYYSVIGRYKEHIGFLDLFEDLSQQELPEAGRNAASALRSLHDQQIYQLLSGGIETTHSAMMPNWVAGSVFYPLKRPGTTIRYLFGWIRERRRQHRKLADAEKELSRLSGE